MGNEMNEDYERFMTNEIINQRSSLGQIVKQYFDAPMVTKQRPEMPLFPGKKWGTYEVRDSKNGIFDGGWAQILVSEKNDSFHFVEKTNFFEIDVNDAFDESQWACAFSVAGTQGRLTSA